MNNKKTLTKKKLRYIYNKKYYICERMGKVVKQQENGIRNMYDIHCMLWRCVECRKILKRMLFFEILKNVYIFGLTRHFVITFGGKDKRDKYSIEESYRIMSEKWKLLHREIERYLEKKNKQPLVYILLPRAQKDGYCHFHLLINQYIPFRFLLKKKRIYELGSMRINKNKDVAEYLCNDFFKDSEWYIPMNKRHYSSSRCIKIRNIDKSKDLKWYFCNKFDMYEIDKYMKMNYSYGVNLDDYIINKSIERFKKEFFSKPENNIKMPIKYFIIDPEKNKELILNERCKMLDM